MEKYIWYIGAGLVIAGSGFVWGWQGAGYACLIFGAVILLVD